RAGDRARRHRARGGRGRAPAPARLGGVPPPGRPPRGRCGRRGGVRRRRRRRLTSPPNVQAASRPSGTRRAAAAWKTRGPGDRHAGGAPVSQGAAFVTACVLADARSAVARRDRRKVEAPPPERPWPARVAGADACSGDGRGLPLAAVRVVSSRGSGPVLRHWLDPDWYRFLARRTGPEGLVVFWVA